MRELKCSDLGYRCTWKHIARTEELLADITAIHLRDVHGVAALNADMVGRIKNAFSSPAPGEDAEVGDLVLKEFECKDLGNRCGWKYIAQTEELIVDGVAVHAREAHGIKEFTPELKVKVQNALHEWRG
jgi:predicted small metal-binding protein